MARPLPSDTRGIIDPAAMMRRVDLQRFPAGDALDGLVEWFWSVAWDLPEGVTHDQPVLTHPAGNISVGTLDDRGVRLDPPEGRVYGVATGLSHRHLAGDGWTVAARTTVGGLGALLDAPARSATDVELALGGAIPGLHERRCIAAIAGAETDEQRVAVLRDALGEAVASRDSALVAEGREVASIARRVETDRSLCRVEQVAADAGMSVRTLQRLFDQHVGVSPSFVIRRWRIIDAAEAARAALESDDAWRGWSAVAAELGYSDQAHLTRDFRRHLGTTPAQYLASATRPST